MKELSSIERVRRMILGQETDRIPVYDLLRNDNAIEYYSGEKLTYENAERVVYKAASRALDATRLPIRFPKRETEQLLPDGRKTRQFRWTEWIEPKQFIDENDFIKYLMENFRISNQKEITEQSHKIIASYTAVTKAIGDVFMFWAVGGSGLQYLYNTVGLEGFSYHMSSCSEQISSVLEINTINTIRLIKEIHTITKGSPCAPGAYMIGEDIAYKSGSIFNPEFLRKEFFPRLKRIIDAIHNTGLKVCFHSDGNLMDILGDLIACGIDMLNPIEVIAGMDIAEIHRRYPKLCMVGGIDVSQLLPFAAPEEVEQAVFKAIDDAGGQIMVGSSTEMNHAVPLENVLALYNAPNKYINKK